MTTNKTNRRSFLGRGAATAAVAATAAAVPAKAQEKPAKKVLRANGTPAPRPAAGAKNPRMSATVLYGTLLFISGVGYHQEGDIKVHTKGVLDSIKKQLDAAGSSMEKCLKCNVYLNDLKDYDGMNAVYDLYFGPEPPARTTIAAAGGIPGNSLVEIDVVAYI
jgi:enamine deaminase RidA (YjgF/YER057c/UK114 family)